MLFVRLCLQPDDVLPGQGASPSSVAHVLLYTPNELWVEFKKNAARVKEILPLHSTLPSCVFRRVTQFLTMNWGKKLEPHLTSV